MSKMSLDTFQFDEPTPSTGSRWFGSVPAWCNERRLLLLILAGAFQFAVLGAMVVIHAAPLVVGETILLRVEPVDPRDLFRGDYVTLGYSFSRVPPEGIEGIADSRPSHNHYRPSRQPEEQTVYVSLEPEADGKYWRGTKISTDRPANGKFIRGVYRRERYSLGQLRYGIEAFYVHEGTGRQYEDAARKRQLAAEIAVAPWGQAKLRGLRIE
jgi:uncharacterized membrane-anchored protein